MKVFCFDTETGGLNPKGNSLLTLGCLVGDLDSGEILEQFEVFHKMPSLTDYNVTPEALEVNQIDLDECFAKGKTKEEIQTLFMDLFYKYGCKLFAGHNLEFDIRFVAHQIFGMDAEALEQNTTYRKIDSHGLIRLYSGIDGMKSGASLKQTAKSLGIDMSDIKGGYHAALYDSICCFRILHKFRKVLTLPEVVEKMGK